MTSATTRRTGAGRRHVLYLALAVIALGLQLPGGAVAASPYTPVGTPGPALSPSPAALAASLSCTPSVTDARVEPVLLSPGTSATATESFGWNWEPALDRLGIPWCAYTAPHNTLGPIDVSGEYLVHAIRTMHAMAGRRIGIVGWSQGGMSMRWALRFWPDTRTMVDDVIGMEPTNQGTTLVTHDLCATYGCPAADWQQTSTSTFIQALNSGQETFSGISYTNIYSAQDEVAQPNADPQHCTSCLHTGDGQIANIQLQQVCPLDIADHVTAASIDPVNYHLVIDALTHAGPADPRRISASACTELLMPGVLDPASAAALIPALEAAVGTPGIVPGPFAGLVSGTPALQKEPALPCYVYAGACPAMSAAASSGTRLVVHLVTRKRGQLLRVRVTVSAAGVTRPVAGATVRAGRRFSAVTDAAGYAVVLSRLGRRCQRLVTAQKPGYLPGRLVVHPRSCRRP